VNSEFYPGWLDFWGTPHSKVATDAILSTFYQMMNMSANVNFYMFHGGTNFGFSNGIIFFYELVFVCCIFFINCYIYKLKKVPTHLIWLSLHRMIMTRL
jgi:hypothetical protein